MLTDKQRQRVISKLSIMSDNEIAGKCGVSRSTVWRIRQDEAAKEAKLKRAAARLKAREKKPVQAKEVETPVPPAPAPGWKGRVESAGVTVEVDVPTVASVLRNPPPLYPQSDVLPKVAVEPVTMANYFAVQLLRGESVKDVACAVMKAAEAKGVLFRKLQVLDCISVGTTSFARFRSDLGDLAGVLNSAERGFIAFMDGCYRVTFTDGRQVKYPTTVMCTVQKAGYGAVYAGPKVQRWAQQFVRAN